ncbi:hypothetical protein CGCSCA4_v006291 [Colletotrichum siamense]|uniref:Uncharacterized protein n=2 Tax=Colletotrichum gloeosporioides species complex TaxID=2707338 RepID=A0A9W4RIQ9_9PEZI|nr:uncharacterized protein CGCS363_v008235 [Colletotrichum siamense]XP_037178223.1 uncharacterized protein CGCA056_v008470 [Colletotrichum aenigma]XP_053032517.1 uncharacterized protein COL26b_010840 [Colletotrichum chrysophilum]KAF4817182.1 hypothetical protein CGCTS75_v012445 [Colletotrichum tropicale]KAH9236840.1 hypothetical protein K456DRAFT_1459002 [Colletotrichum gloeosporioides 23]KAI8172345.1 hypothetical protein KHU50_005067 [Colletotrichum sp. SAR 10_65]KAI8177304.1 hypothetical pr
MARATPTASLAGDKPLPTRPGTSGTENLLRTNRRQASDNYQRAQRAERTYRAKKRATAARADLSDAKTHYAECFKHLTRGLAVTFSAVKSLPYVFDEKQEAARQKAEAKKKQRALEKKKKLEEKLARENAAAEGETPAEDAAAEDAPAEENAA